MAKDSKSAKKNKQTQKVEAPRKEGGLFWLAVVIILGVLAFVWIVKTYGPKGGGVPDDALVRVVIREQFDAVFAKDLDKFLSYYSTDYDSGIQTFDEKAEMIRQVFDTEFVVRDFVLEFLDSGEDNTDVHFDESRGFASVVVYTYWKQRTGESITRIPLMQLSAFLLRKEGDEWKIISDNSQGLNKKEDADAWMRSSHFRQYTDPKTFVWPPPRTTEAPAVPQAGNEPQSETDTGETPSEAGTSDG